MNKRVRREKGAGGLDTSVCARKLHIPEGDKSDGCSRETSLFITCLVLYVILECLISDEQKNNEVILAGW